MLRRSLEVIYDRMMMIIKWKLEIDFPLSFSRSLSRTLAFPWYLSIPLSVSPSLFLFFFLYIFLPPSVSILFSICSSLYIIVYREGNFVFLSLLIAFKVFQHEAKSMIKNWKHLYVFIFLHLQQNLTKTTKIFTHQPKLLKCVTDYIIFNNLWKNWCI